MAGEWDPKRFFRLKQDEDLTKNLGFRYLIFASVHIMPVSPPSSHCLYVVQTVRSIVYVFLFEFLFHDLEAHNITLGQQFYPKVKLMYNRAPFEPNIPTFLREFGFYVERDSLVQRIQLWRAFVSCPNGSDAFNRGPNRIKPRPSWQWTGIIRCSTSRFPIAWCCKQPYQHRVVQNRAWNSKFSQCCLSMHILYETFTEMVMKFSVVYEI